MNDRYQYGTRSPALEKGIAKVRAIRVANSEVVEKDGARLAWAYFAEETQSWWLVSEDALHTLGARQLDYDTWAEQDSTAQEHGKRKPREWQP